MVRVKCVWVFLFTGLSFGVFAMEGREIVENGVFVSLPPQTATAQSATVINYLRNALQLELQTQGLKPFPQERARFLLTVSTQEVENRIFLSVRLHDNLDGAVLYSAVRSVVPGLLAQTFLDEVVQNAVSVATQSQNRFTLLRSVTYNLVFTSPTEGVRIYFGHGQGRQFLGEITNGTLEAPYYPLEEGSFLTISLEKEGHRSRLLDIALTPERPKVEIDPLFVDTHHQLALGYSLTRWMGFRAGYRYFFLPDQFFLGGDLSLWFLHGFTAQSQLVSNVEPRIAVGSYFFFPADFWFRFCAGVASSMLFIILPVEGQSWVFSTLTLEPVWVSLEYNQHAYTVFLEARIPFVVWETDLFTPGPIGLNLTVGGALKW